MLDSGRFQPYKAEDISSKLMSMDTSMPEGTWHRTFRVMTTDSQGARHALAIIMFHMYRPVQVGTRGVQTLHN